MELRSLLRATAAQVRESLERVASLSDDEVRALQKALAKLKVPINERSIEPASLDLNRESPRLSPKEWGDVARAALEFARESDSEGSLGLLADLAELQPGVRESLERIARSLRSQENIRGLIALDSFLERGPRLKSITCFCDVRVKFSDTKINGEQKGTPREEARLPIALVRLNVDEIAQPVYFQMVESEISEMISRLEAARQQLRQLEDGLEASLDNRGTDSRAS
jgi:hypothetical protein